MPQNPTIPPYDPTSVAFNERVAQAALGIASFAQVPSWQQGMIEQNGQEVFSRVYMVARRLGHVGDNDDLPSEFQSLFFDSTVLKTLMTNKASSDEQIAMWRAMVNDHWLALTDKFTDDSTMASAGGVEISTFARIETWVVNQTVRLTEGRTFVPFTSDVDQATRDAWRRVWNCAMWPFRYKQVIMTIQTDGSFTIDNGVGGGIDAIGTQRYYYEDQPGQFLSWATHDSMAFMLSRDQNQAPDRPKLFIFQDDGATQSMVLYPKPDQEYKVYGAIILRTPTLSSGRTVQDGFNLLPSEFHPLLWRLVLSETLINKGVMDVGNRIRNSALNELKDWGQEYADDGKSDSVLQQNDGVSPILAAQGDTMDNMTSDFGGGLWSGGMNY